MFIFGSNSIITRPNIRPMRNLLTVFCVLFISVVYATSSAIPDSARVPDKVFLHLDKTLYAQGDTLWFKAYVFHRNDNCLSSNSYALSIQVLNELGQQIGTHKLLLINGIGFGQIPIYSSMKPGYYQIIAHSAQMKNFRSKFFFKTTIEVRNQYSELSVKPFFDKTGYKIGDTAKVTFRAYDEFQQVVPKQRFRYELSYKDEKLQSKGLKCNDDGTVTSYIPIEKGDRAHPPKLRLTYYEKTSGEEVNPTDFYVPMAKEKMHIGIYPEGGDLINSITSKVAFEITDELGRAMDATISVLRDKEIILTTNTMHEGRGFFSLKPDNDSPYTMKVSNNKGIDTLIAFPEIREQGYYLSYFRQNDDNVSLLITHNFEGDKAVNLWVSQNDKLIDTYSLMSSNTTRFQLEKANLPTGLVTITLTDDTNTPCCERMVYVDKNQPQIIVSTPKAEYTQRKKVEVSIKIPGVTSTAHLSATVIDSFIGNSPNLEKHSILSYAYLQSELRDYKDYSNVYFKGDRLSLAYRDLMIMTHGWSRYSWISNNKRLSTANIYDFNKVKGQVKRFKKPVANAPMTALVMGGGLAFLEFETDSLGWFSVYPVYESYQAPRLILQAKNSNGRNNVWINLMNSDTILYNYTVKHYKDELKPLLYSSKQLYTDNESLEDDAPFNFYETKLLKELVVFGSTPKEEDNNSLTERMSAFAAGSISGEDLIGGFAFADFVQQASFKAKYDITNDVFFIESSADNNQRMSNSESEMGADEIGAQIYLNDDRWGIRASDLDFLTKEDIAEIVVIDKIMAQSMYGSEGEYGAILVRSYSTDFTAKKDMQNQNMAIFGGFINTKETYSPNYSVPGVDNSIVVDNRVTLHWEPLIETNKTGEANFSFYTDDVGGPKQIIVQGIDDDGHFFYSEHNFDVNIVVR